jgi:oligoendopeptidase F
MKNNKYTWDLSPLYKSDNDPQIDIDIEDISKKVDSFINKWKKDTSYLKDPKVLANAFNEIEEISGSEVILEKPLAYFWLRKSQESDNSEIKGKYSKINDKEVELTNKMSFFTSNIIKKIPKSLQDKFLNEPLLKEYQHTLTNAFIQKKHLLSEKEERVYRLLAKTSVENWSNMIDEFVSKSSVKNKGKEITFEQALKQIQDKDKSVRDLANKAIKTMLLKVVDSAEYELNSVIKAHNIASIEHKYKSFDQSRHQSEDIDTDVVHSMVKSVTEKFNVSHRYYSLYAKLLNQSKLKYHERVIDIDTKESQNLDFELALDITKRTFKQLDKEFLEIFENLINHERFDAHPRKGKTGGAFCFNLSKNLPIYILLNFTGKSRDVSTIAHESGHAIHAYLSHKHQHPANASPTLSTGEVASTFFEDFALQEMNKSLDKERKFYTLQTKLKDEIATVFRQVACYNFELELHDEVEKKGFLSKEEIGNLFQKHMSSYLGEAVEFNPEHKLWWIYWSHIRSPFYVYSYASGLLISKSLQNKVRKDSAYISNVKGFLSAGSSKSTKDIFLDLGIDISKKEFWIDGIAEIENMLNEFELLGKELGKFK